MSTSREPRKPAPVFQEIRRRRRWRLNGPPGEMMLAGSLLVFALYAIGLGLLSWLEPGR